MTALTLVALFGTGGVYLYLSWRIAARTTTLQDYLPIALERGEARVQNSREFSAATVATTISLATLILAYAELAPFLGTWLLWTVVTTALGIFAVRLAAPVIWRRMAVSAGHRPTIHDFLGHAFESNLLKQAAALCTSLGFLGALAVELTVGARFLAELAPEFPQLLAVLLLAAIGVAYTVLGGFRAVVVTDRIQMWAIWAAIFALAIAILYGIAAKGGLSFLAQALPVSVYDFSWRAGLGAFLLGIFVINVPTFLADMSVWQRIAASRDEATVTSGLGRSVALAAASWTAFALLACLLVALVPASNGQNPLLVYLSGIATSGSIWLAALFVVIVAGFYAASLSTASTQLVATAHTLHADILRTRADKSALVNKSSELLVSRLILASGAVAAVAVVEVLRAFGFSIADLVFAVYGAQLGLVPPVLLALFSGQDLRRMGRWASIAVIAGFAAGWSSAAIGKVLEIADLVFLAPAASLAASGIVLCLGVVARKSPWPRKAG